MKGILEKERKESKIILRKEKLKEKGITLIALVVTIIILLILSGVTLSIALSQNGLINQAVQVRRGYTIESIREILEAVKGSAYIEGKGTTNLTQYFECLDKEKIEPHQVTNKGEITGKLGFVEVDDEYSYLVEFDSEGNIKVEYEGEAGEIDRGGGIVTAKIEGETTQSEMPIKLTATVETTKGSINNLKWILTKESENIGTDENNYTNSESSNIINLQIEEADTSYLHILVIDKYGRKSEIVSNAITVAPYYYYTHSVAKYCSGNLIYKSFNKQESDGRYTYLCVCDKCGNTYYSWVGDPNHELGVVCYPCNKYLGTETVSGEGAELPSGATVTNTIYKINY